MSGRATARAVVASARREVKETMFGSLGRWGWMSVKDVLGGKNSESAKGQVVVFIYLSGDNSGSSYDCSSQSRVSRLVMDRKSFRNRLWSLSGGPAVMAILDILQNHEPFGAWSEHCLGKFIYSI